MYLTHQERQTLRLAVDMFNPAFERKKSNQALDRIVAEIRAANPDAFHTKETLPERVFFHKPRGNVPCRDYLRD